MRNPFPGHDVLSRAYLENAQLAQKIPTKVIPPLLKKSQPIHEYVKVDVYIPGCPPSADRIFFAVSELLAGRRPELAGNARFG